MILDIKKVKSDDKIKDVYMITTPIVLKDFYDFQKLYLNTDSKNLKEILLENFYEVDLIDKSSDNLYLDVVKETFYKDYECFSFFNKEDINKYKKFILNQKTINSSISFDLIDANIFIKKEDNSKRINMYLNLVVKNSSEKNKQEVIRRLSERISLDDKKVTGSFFDIDGLKTFYIIGSERHQITNVINYLFRTEIKEDISYFIEFPFGKRSFLTSLIKDKQFFDLNSAIIDAKNKGTLEDKIYNNEFILETNYNYADIINNAYESKNYYETYLNKNEIDKKFNYYSKWKNQGSIFNVSPMSFINILNEEHEINIYKHLSNIFSKYIIGIFFAINERVLLLDLQENIKGVKENSPSTITSYYAQIEKKFFYEISAEEQIQELFTLLQKNFKNEELLKTIYEEIEIHENKRLNELFKRLTNYGIVIAVIALIIALYSYFATYLGTIDRYFYKFISTLLSDPFIMFGIIGTVYLKTKDFLGMKKSNNKLFIFIIVIMFIIGLFMSLLEFNIIDIIKGIL